MGASRGRLEVCKLLLARGADPTMRDDGGRCAADLADSGAPPELKKLLLEKPRDKLKYLLNRGLERKKRPPG